MPLENVRACVFDAYGTLFDFNSATFRCRDALGDKTDTLSDIWRTKQLQYTWLRGLMGKHADFWQVTGEALDYALSACEISDPAIRERLMNLYSELDPYPEVPAMLQRLNASGIRCAILSNGTPAMLESAANSAGLAANLDHMFSVEEVGIFKPHPSVYDLPVKHLGLEPGAMAFMSANSWDGVAASAFGFQVVWVNRAGQPKETLPWQPALELDSLEPLPDIVTKAK